MLHNKTLSGRTLSIAIAIVLLILTISAGTENVLAASKLKVTPANKTIYAGKTVKLKANAKVKWSVPKNNGIVKLTAVKKKTVTVKGLKAGSVYVTAKAGKQTRKVRIVVKRSDAPSSIDLITSSNSVGVGEYCTVSILSVTPKSASNEVTYTTSDKSIASVNSRGLVQGRSEGEVKITAISKADSSVTDSVTINVVNAAAGTLTLSVDMSDETRYPAGKTAKVWLPVPQSDNNQAITGVKVTAPGAKRAELTTDSAGGKQMYIEWDENAAPDVRKASLSYHLYRKAVVRDENIASMEHGTVAEAAAADPAVAKALEPTMWSGEDSEIVKETLDRIFADKDANTVYDKAFAIYDYMCDNMIRTDDKKVLFGDVVSILEGKRYAGSCMDMNSVFVSLCRAEGIPARNMFGFRFTTLGPNCRAEFYLPGYGWVPADPALAIKKGRGLDAGPKLDYDPVWEGIKDLHWGNGEENWICVNMGRDITLDPPQSIVPGEEYLEVLNPDGTINLLMFPYGEYGDQYIPCQDSKNFKYVYSFDEEDPLDCGC